MIFSLHVLLPMHNQVNEILSHNKCLQCKMQQSNLYKSCFIKNSFNWMNITSKNDQITPKRYYSFQTTTHFSGLFIQHWKNNASIDDHCEKNCFLPPKMFPLICSFFRFLEFPSLVYFFFFCFQVSKQQKNLRLINMSVN